MLKSCRAVLVPRRILMSDARSLAVEPHNADDGTIGVDEILNVLDAPSTPKSAKSDSPRTSPRWGVPWHLFKMTSPRSLPQPPLKPQPSDDGGCLDDGIDGLTIRPTAVHSYAKPEMALRVRNNCAEANLERCLKVTLDGLERGSRVNAWLEWVSTSGRLPSLERALEFGSGSSGQRLELVADAQGVASFDFRFSRDVFRAKAGTLRRLARLCIEARGDGAKKTLASHPFKVMAKFHDSGGAPRRATGPPSLVHSATSPVISLGRGLSDMAMRMVRRPSAHPPLAPTRSTGLPATKPLHADDARLAVGTNPATEDARDASVSAQA